MKSKKKTEDARLTKKQAKEMVIKRNDNMIHTFYNAPWGLIGMNHTKESVIEDIDNSFMCKLTGKQAQATGYGLVIIPTKKCKQSDLLFVETNEVKIK